MARTWACMLACHKLEETEEVFAFPSWAARKCCWRCQATNSPGLDFDFVDATLTVAWRAHRYKSHEFVFVQRTVGICPSTLFQSPHASVDAAMIEGLHTMDQGVLADIIVSSKNNGCGQTLHALHLGSCARAQAGELLLESTFCASQQLQWHCGGQCREVLGCI